MKRKLAYVLLFLIFAGVAGYSGYQIYTTLHEYNEGETAYEQLQQYVVMPSQATDETLISSEAADSAQWPIVDFDALLAINEDVAAWIYIEGTNINYPVVQGDDNNYYLRRLLDGTYNSSGSIFMDYRNASDFSDRHIIIYGHHMQNNSMFSGLMDYKQQEFYDAHPVALLITPEHNYKVEFFSGYIASVNDDSWKLDFDSDEDFITWCEYTKEKSLFSSEITPGLQDQIVTLSTCSYEFDDARFVLVGILR